MITNQSQQSHNAPILYPTMHHFVTEVFTCVHISATKWCIVVYSSDASWDFWDGSIDIFIRVTSWWARWRLKLPASRLFTQSFIQTQIKENIKAPRHWPLRGEFTGDRGPVNSPHKWPVTQKMFSFDDVIILPVDHVALGWLMTKKSSWDNITSPP